MRAAETRLSCVAIRHRIDAADDSNALRWARTATGEEEGVPLRGAAAVAQPHLAASAVDEIVVWVVPIQLRGGARLFENVGRPKLGQVASSRHPA